jgi:FixJ family two-component response regulator
MSSTMKSAACATVFVADDDADTRLAIEKVLRSVGLRVDAFSSADALVEQITPDRFGCVVLNLRRQSVSVAEHQQKLKERGCRIPVIVLTDRDDVTTAVHAMRAGALDVLARPFSDQTLIDDVHRALVHDRVQRQLAMELDELQRRYVQLTRREREVMALLTAGALNRQVGETLGITERTVKAHRAQVLQKMMAASLPDLIRMAGNLAGSPAQGVSVSIADKRPARLRP